VNGLFVDADPRCRLVGRKAPQFEVILCGLAVVLAAARPERGGIL
jgi:hypothetical protein